MRLPRFTTRRLMVLVALVAVAFATYAALLRTYGLRPGGHPSPYRYLDRTLRWREVRGGVIWVSPNGGIFVD
jgi:hypothetical protein